MEGDRRKSERIKQVLQTFGKSYKKRKSDAENSLNWRKRIKLDPIAYEKFKKDEQKRQAKFRKKLNEDEEKKKMYNIKAYERLKRFRKKKKNEKRTENAVMIPKMVKVKTKAETEQLRETWAQSKRKQYSNESPEERDKRNFRRRELYALKQKAKQEATKKQEVEKETKSKTKGSEQLKGLTGSPYKLMATAKKATQRARKGLPKDSYKAAEVIVKLVNSATPGQKLILNDKLNVISPKTKKRLEFAESSLEEVRSSFEKIKKKRSKVDNRNRVMLALLFCRKKYTHLQHSKIGYGRKLIKTLNKEDPFSRQKRKDAVTEQVKELVASFYRKPEVSRQLPDARGVKQRRDGQLVSRRVMEMSMKSAHEAFAAGNPDVKIGRSLFAALKPDDVLPTTSCRFRDCLCEYCANIDLKLEALRIFGALNGLKGIGYKDRYDLSRSTLCPKGQAGEYRQECLERKCPNCGTSAIERQLRPLLETHVDKTMHFKKWRKADQEGGKKRMKRLSFDKKAPDFVSDLCEDVKSFSKHLFNASYQSRQYDSLAKSVPEGLCLVCEDFAENFKTKYQDEAQGAHWGFESVTLHACVANYKCDCEGCDVMVTDSIILISDDLSHDVHSVNTFHKHMMTYLQTVQDRPPFKKIIMFSDGAPTQYKNKASFMDLTHFEDDFGIPMERHFFGTRHGKGPCDREFGTLKSALGRQIKARSVEADTPRALYDFCQAKYSKPAPPRGQTPHLHFRRKFVFVSKTEIERGRQRVGNLKVLAGTRDLHSFRPMSKGLIEYRQRSCFCGVCLGEEGKCTSEDITGEWSIASLQKGVQAPVRIFLNYQTAL